MVRSPASSLSHTRTAGLFVPLFLLGKRDDMAGLFGSSGIDMVDCWLSVCVCVCLQAVA